jgi:DNA ligase (NAD+)
VCGSELLDEGKLIKCQNINCPARVVNSIIYFASKQCMNIDGLGEKIVEQLYEAGLVKELEDIYHLTMEELLKLEGFKEKKIERPTKCPVCGSELLDEGKLIKCQNINCPARVVNSIIYFASKQCMNIDGLGEKIVEQLYEAGLVKELEDIYHLTMEDLLKLEGFKEKKAKNLLDAIERSKGAECWRFVNGLGIEHIGEVASRKICQTFGLDFMDVTKEQLLAIEGFGEEMAESYLEFMRVNREKVRRLLEIIRPVPPEKETIVESPFTGKTVVLTGTMKKPRGEIKAMLEHLGAKVTGTVSRKTDFVIYGEDPGSKYDKAKQLGVELMSEEKMWELAGEA